MTRTFLPLFFLFLMAPGAGEAQEKNSHKSVLDITANDDFSSFAMLDSVVGNYNVFFTGENHLFRKSNYMLQLKMLRYLHKKAGVRHLFLEFGYSRGWLVNKYVQTGDTSLYKILKDYSYEEYALLYKGIWEFNKTLDSADRVTVDGIDIERSVATPLKVLSMLLPEKEAPEEISLTVESLKALALMHDDKNDRDELEEDGSKNKYENRYISDKSSLKKILEDYDTKKEVYINYLGENAAGFNEIIEGLKSQMVREEYTSTVQEYIYREQFMYDKFLKMVEKYPGGKFYAQFGRCHTQLELQDKWCGYYYYKTLATRIRNSDNTHINGKVCAIANFYPNGNTYETEVAAEEDLKYITDKSEDGKQTLYRVEGDSVINEKFGGRFQYVIISRIKPSDDPSVVSKKEDKKEEKFDPYSEENEDFYYLYNFEFHPYSIKPVSLKKFNESLASLTGGAFSFDGMLVSVGGAFTYIYNELDYATLSVDIYTTQQYNFNDSVSMSLGGEMIRLCGGAELTYGSLFNFSVYGGLAYSTLRFDYREEFPNSPSSSLFNQYDVQVAQYRNPALMLDAGLDLRLNWKLITLGVNGGYQLDVTDKQWKTNGSIDPFSPRTSLSGWYLNMAAGLFIGTRW